MDVQKRDPSSFDFEHGRGLEILDRWLHAPCIEKRTTGMAECMGVMLNESLALVYHCFGLV